MARGSSYLLSIWRQATGVPALIIALLWLMVLISIGTIAQKDMPLIQAQQVYFAAPLYWLGGVLPLPGTSLVLGYISLSLLVQAVRQPFTKASAGTWLTHAGVLMLILSGLAATLLMQTGYLVATEGTPTRLWQGEGANDETPTAQWPAIGLLPFNVRVDKFQYRIHPGTDIPAFFASDVTIIPDDGVAWQAAIRMNEPLRVDGYTIYQSSYLLPQDGPPISILAVVKDRTRLLPYLATGVIGLGLLAQLVLRRRLGKAAVIGAMILGAQGVQAEALTAAQLRDFGMLPVQHHGRVKPMATVADTLVPFVTGERTHTDAALALMADWLFSPATATATPLHMNPRAVEVLHLPAQETYTLGDLVAAMVPREAEVRQLDTVAAAKLSGPQKLLLETRDRVETLLSIARTLAMVRPLAVLDADTAAALDLPEGPVDAAALMTRREAFVELTQAMAKTKKPGARDVAIYRLGDALRGARPEQPNGLLRVIPPVQGEAWFSIWEATRMLLDAEQAKVFEGWRTLAKGDVATGLAQLAAADAVHVSPLRMGVEVFTLRYPPISLALIPLGLALLAAFGWRRDMAPLALTGLAVLGVGILARVLILGRPPVATLYESVLFVAWFTLALAWVFRRTSSATLPAGLVVALVLTAVSHGLTQGQDTLGMLTAVLDTNFWLATHVLTITGGYAASLLAGGVGLWAMVQRALRKTTPAGRAGAHKVLRHLTTISLLLVAVGTLLGGIWASQSWGRFWGWDPKENGALVLTLWLAMVAHMRLLKPIPIRWWLAAAAFTPVIVALSWFGVNLLSVGLHSYGFTTQMAGGLLGFCLVMVTVVALLVVADRHKVHKP